MKHHLLVVCAKNVLLRVHVHTCSFIQVLTLVKSDVDELPLEFGQLLPSLTELNLSNNCLTGLPASVGAMTRLRALSACHNKLSGLPPSLWTCSSLEGLWLSHNALDCLPEALGQLQSLAVLDVAHNRVSALPQALTSLGGSLVCLDVSYNELHVLPVGFMHSMARLEELQLQYNQLASCPEISSGGGGGHDGNNHLSSSLSCDLPQALDAAMPAPRTSAAGRSPLPLLQQQGPSSPISSSQLAKPSVHLQALRRLSLASNGLRHVPAWLPPGLVVLDLSRNNIVMLPEWFCARLGSSLVALHLQSNSLEVLPQEIRTLSHLLVVSLDDNPMSSPERVSTANGAGWVAEWLYRKKYRSRPEVAASLATTDAA